MPTEIERKFLVRNNNWKDAVKRSFIIKQGYLNSNAERTVRVRLKGDEGFITIKGKSKGISRAEFEYKIPVNEAEQILLLCEESIIRKTRFEVNIANHLWEIDVFKGANKGLIIAEIELSSEQENFELPTWIGKEVSDDKRYYNSHLAKNPFCQWNTNDYALTNSKTVTSGKMPTLPG